MSPRSQFPVRVYYYINSTDNMIRFLDAGRIAFFPPFVHAATKHKTPNRTITLSDTGNQVGQRPGRYSLEYAG